MVSDSNYGLVHTEKTLKKMSESHEGFKHSEESKILMSENRQGIVFSDDHVKNLSISHVGERNKQGILNNNLVRSIRNCPKYIGYLKDLSEMLGINYWTICCARYRRSWKHI